MGEVGRGPPVRCLRFIISCREPPGDFRRRSDFPLAVCGKQTKGAERKWETRGEPPAGRGFRWRVVGGRWGLGGVCARAGRWRVIEWEEGPSTPRGGLEPWKGAWWMLVPMDKTESREKR